MRTKDTGVFHLGSNINFRLQVCGVAFTFKKINIWLKWKSLENLYPSPFASEPNAWECGYFTREIAQGFGQIYDNVNGVADDFAQFWKILAQR